MASFDPVNTFDFESPPPRPTTPPVRRGFLILLGVLLILTGLVYGIPYLIRKSAYAWEAGRNQAAADTLRSLDEAGILNRASALFRMATDRVAPSVVNIRSMRLMTDRLGRRIPTQIGAGSGFVIDRNRGYIVTNHHVIKDAEELIIRLGQGEELDATLVGSDPKTDIAVLKVDQELPIAAEWGDADRADIGDWVLAIGSPFQLDQTVTAGIISAIGRRNLRIVDDGTGYEDFIQTDAAVNPGNSGGPLVDLSGKVIGINTAIFSTGGNEGNQGIGFAISATLACKVVQQIIDTGRVTRGYIGVQLDLLDRDRSKQAGLAKGRAILFRDVDPDGPADRAGLQPGDIVIALDDQPIVDTVTLRNTISAATPGTRFKLTYIRGGREASAEVVVAEMPLLRALGIRLRDQGPAPDQISVVIDQVMPNSPAYYARLEPGMRIATIGDRPVSSKAEAYALAQRANPKAGVTLGILLPDGSIAPVPVLEGNSPR
jgi:serine protease Do